MKKAIKITSIIVIMLFLCLCGFFINNLVAKKNEANYISNSIGNKVVFEEKNLNVYQAGSGNDVYLLMADVSTVSPIFAFESLVDELSSKGKVVIVERFGYGFSDLYDTNQDLATMLLQTRFALSEIDCARPEEGYILVPHGSAVIEALNWSQLFPDEVKAIIGINPLIPEIIAAGRLQSSFTYDLQHLMNWIGISRVTNSANDLPGYSALSDDEKRTYEALYYRNVCNSVILDELDALCRNAQMVVNNEKPDVPMYFFASTETSLTSVCDEALSILNDYVGENYVLLQGGNFIHVEMPKKVAELTNKFIKSIE